MEHPINHHPGSHPGGHPGGPMSKNQLRLIFWELTSGCNLKCIHCRAEAQDQRLKNELSTDEIKGVIDNIVTFSNPIVILTGGEPLYRPDFFEIARYGTDQGLRIAMASNGTLIDPGIADRIKEAGVQRVAISIDGSDAQTHDTFRAIPGSFEAALRGARLLRDRGIEFQFNSTITKNNLHQVEPILDLAVREKAKALHIFMLVPVGCGVTIAEEQMLPAEEYERVLNWFYDALKKVDIEFRATCAPHYFRIMRQRAKEEGITVTPQTHGMAASTKGCLAGSAVCFISSLGQVQPCGYLPVKAGNVREEPFAKVWAGSTVFENLRDTSKLGGKCGLCEYRNVCEGCRARAFAEYGDYMAEEPYCIYTPQRSVSSA